MPSSTVVLERMDQRVAKLADGFDEYVRVFGKSERFTGPSGYFHRKTLAQRAQHLDIASLLHDDAFFDSSTQRSRPGACTAWVPATRASAT